MEKYLRSTGILKINFIRLSVSTIHKKNVCEKGNETLQFNKRKNISHLLKHWLSLEGHKIQGYGCSCNLCSNCSKADIIMEVASLTSQKNKNNIKDKTSANKGQTILLFPTDTP